MWTSKLSTQLSRRLDNDSFHGFAAAVGVLTGAEVIRRHQKLEEPALETDHSTTATSVLAKLSGCSMLAQSSAINQHECKLQWLPDHLVSMPPGLRRQATFARLHETAIKDTLQSKYAVNWKKPLGEGTFGTVYLGKDRKTGLNVAVKRITKDFTDDESFQREMDTLLLLRDSGGHPHICGLRENYEAGEYYYLVLDLISGGEMFEHLCEKGAYSEADAARLIREVASALAFMHGIGIVHGDMKPENLMLSSENASDAAVKVVDFGCSHLIDREKDKLNKRPNSNTPAYSPPEILDQKDTVNPLEPSFDMWAMGVIIYIMLTGMHPFDPHGNSSEAEIAASILSNKKLTLRNSPMTAHLSPDAVDVIEMLMNRDPAARSSALELLQNPWVLGEKASTQKMVGSDKRLNAYREFKTKLEAKVFADMLTWSENNDPNDMAKRTSLIERFFQNLNPDSNGFVAASDLRKVTRHQESGDEEDDKLSLSGFSNLLAENMKNVYFEKGSQVYREGEEGHAMYFINSGSVEEVYTRDGFNKTVRTAGDFFGEGALMNPSKMRVDSIQCVTPVHAIEISREYFDKYLLTEEGAVLNLREKDRDRKRQRAKQILALQMSLKQKTLKKGDYIFKKGDGGNDFFISESGEVGLSLDGNKLVTLGPDQFIGEHALLFNRRRNCTAQCLSDECNLQVVNAREFYALLDSNPTVRESMTDLSYRREFLKAVALRTKTEFSRKDLRTEAELKVAFDKVVSDSKTGAIDLAEIRSMIKDFDSGYNEADVKSILSSVDLNNSGSVTWDEFVHIFRMSPDKK